MPGLGRRDSEPEIDEVFSPDPPPSEQVAAGNPWLTVNPAIDQNPMTLQQPAPQTTPQSVVQQAKPQAAFEPQAQVIPQPKLHPQVQGTSGVAVKAPDWLHRPAPMGAVILLGGYSNPSRVSAGYGCHAPNPDPVPCGDSYCNSYL